MDRKYTTRNSTKEEMAAQNEAYEDTMDFLKSVQLGWMKHNIDVEFLLFGSLMALCSMMHFQLKDHRVVVGFLRRSIETIELHHANEAVKGGEA
tara:strand:+ start:1539 stop:1820 length:282 start_codon:yes stop_codon:yes gene_type:complete